MGHLPKWLQERVPNQGPTRGEKKLGCRRPWPMKCGTSPSCRLIPAGNSLAVRLPEQNRGQQPLAEDYHWGWDAVGRVQLEQWLDCEPQQKSHLSHWCLRPQEGIWFGTRMTKWIFWCSPLCPEYKGTDDCFVPFRTYPTLDRERKFLSGIPPPFWKK